MANTSRVTTLTCAAIAALLAASSRVARAEPDALVVPGLIADESTVPLDAFGEPQFEAVPGARQREALSPAVDARLRTLDAERAAVGDASAAGAAPDPGDVLAGEADAPPRVDSGSRDPDRLREAPARPRR